MSTGPPQKYKTFFTFLKDNLSQCKNETSIEIVILKKRKGLACFALKIL